MMRSTACRGQIILNPYLHIVTRSKWPAKSFVRRLTLKARSPTGCELRVQQNRGRLSGKTERGSLRSRHDPTAPVGPSRSAAGAPVILSGAPKTPKILALSPKPLNVAVPLAATVPRLKKRPPPSSRGGECSVLAAASHDKPSIVRHPKSGENVINFRNIRRFRLNYRIT